MCGVGVGVGVGLLRQARNYPTVGAVTTVPGREFRSGILVVLFVCKCLFVLIWVAVYVGGSLECTPGLV